MNVKNTARLAVCAGLCASMTLGGLPLPAIAAEIEGAKNDQPQKIDELPIEQMASELSEDIEETNSLDKGVDGAEAGNAAPTSNGASDAAGAASVANGAADFVGSDATKPVPSEVGDAAVEVVGLAGKGTAEDPYQVSTAEELRFVAQKVNDGDAAYSQAHYNLTANIDLSGVEWAPIGTNAHKFTGTFVGTGFTISNLTINDAELECAGLFGAIASPAKISGINLNNVTVTAKSCAGGLVGSAFTGAISNCHVTGVVKITAHYKVGGLAGDGYASIANCSVAATGDSFVTGVYTNKGKNLEGDNVGGLVGFRGEGNTSTANCSVSGIKVSGTRKVGGLIGSAYADNKVEGCSVSNVSLACNAPYDYAKSVKNQLCVGGLIGIFHGGGSVGTVKDCSVSNISMSVAVPEVAKEGWPILGLVSGGYRASSLSGASAPDGKVNIEGLKVEGTNTGLNAEEKFPGSVAMNGTSSVFEKGSGTAEDPYIISSVDDLKLLQKAVNSTGLTYEGKYFKIADGAEFDLSGEQWTSIGIPEASVGGIVLAEAKPFCGTLDGGGATIKGLTDAGASGTHGLFGAVSGATIRNMKFVDVQLDYVGSNRGAVAGCLYGTNTIENIEVSGSIAGRDYVGGIAGRPYLNANNPGVLTIKNCVNNATITSNGAADTKIGGIVGYARADVADSTLCVVEGCVNNGTVSGAQYAGGIAGWAFNAELRGCTNTAKVSGSTSAGGIVGNTNQNSKIDSCKNAGEILQEGDSDGGAGGIVGVSNSGNAVVTKCANTGSVTGVKSAGGIIGGTASAGDAIENCYNGGAITATGDKAVAAGIYGYNNSTSPVKACFNDGAIKADKGTVHQIGLSNYWYDQATGSKISSCYYLDDNGVIYAAADDGKGSGIEQKGMTRGELAEVLNVAGGVGGFWQAQNNSVQPDPLIPGAWDDEGRAVAEVNDAKGDVVERYESLDAALAAAKDGQTVKLVKSVDLTQMVKVSNKAITLDLGGNEIKQTKNDFAIVALNGAKLIITNGTVASDGSKCALYAQNASIATMDLQVKASTAFQIGNKDNPGQLDLGKGTVVSAINTGVVIVGPYDADSIPADGAQFSRVVVNKGAKISATEGYGISGNGMFHGTEVLVKGGEIVSAKDVAIYHPQVGTLTLAGGTVQGKTGVQMCSGNLVVPEDSTVVVIADGVDDRENKNENDGSIMDGSAVSIVNRDYPGGMPTADIKGGTFKSEKGQAILDYMWMDKAASEWVDAGEFVDVSGGSFSHEVPEDLLAEGFGNNLEKGEDGLFRVHKHVWADKLESNKDGHWHVCTKCDEKTEVVAHVEKIIGAKPATCGEDGYTGDTACADCGYVIEKGAVIPATGKHAAGDVWKSDGTSHWHECTGCGSKLDKAEHESSKWVANDTDHWRLCDECGAAFEVSAHDFGDWKVTKEPTAAEAGSRERVCKTCGKVVSEAIPALGSASQGGKPGKDDKLAQTGDTSMFGMAAAGIAGISSALAGIFTARKRRDDE